MDLNVIREHSYDRGALADSFTAGRNEPTTTDVKGREKPLKPLALTIAPLVRTRWVF